MTRREILSSLAVVPLLPLAAYAASGDALRLDGGDEPLARLGALLAAEDPALARALSGQVASWIDARGPRGCESERRRAARRVLLDPERVAHEYERREIVRIDGWVLSRSEASVCAYLHAAASRVAQPS